MNDATNSRAGSGSARRRRSSSLSKLTPREFEVLALVAQGWRSGAVAAELGVRESTIKTHLFNIYRKLGVTNRVEAATRYARAQATTGRRPRRG